MLGMDYALAEEWPAQSYSELQSQNFVQRVLKHLQGGSWILLNGDLGAGKTTFVRTLLLNLSGLSDVTSPTFPVLNVLDVAKCAVQGVISVVHLDLYRVRNARELVFLGAENHVHEGAIVVVEWPDVADEADWENFFEVTRCMRPTQIVEIGIGHMPDDASRREYNASFYLPS